METVFSNFGIEIIKKEAKLYMRYDAGEIVSQIKEIEISECEAIDIKSQKDSKSLYNYLIKNLNNRM